MVDIDERRSDSDVFYNTSANPASTEIPALHSNTPPPPGKQSYPTTNLNSHILKSGQPTGRGTNMKKVSGLPTGTAVNSNGKHGRGARLILVSQTLQLTLQNPRERSSAVCLPSTLVHTIALLN